MTYTEVIRRNCSLYTPTWWPKYAYHYTDVTNAISILTSGRLYSRVRADVKGVMDNDNASRQVIDMTQTKAVSSVRFYFRPLTPTQYHNEGYKHRVIRYMGDNYANVPVPIFFLFDLERILKLEQTMFSAQTQAGYGRSALLQGVEAFSQLPFDKIYSDGPAPSEIISYRHAEILYPDEFLIDDKLKTIACRNECEKATLLNMLKSTSPKTYFKYKNIIRVAKEHTFQQNGFFTESVLYHDHKLSFTFAETPGKIAYVKRYNKGNSDWKMKATFYFEWRHSDRILYSSEREVPIDYLGTRTVEFSNLPDIKNARVLRVALKIEGSSICMFEQPLLSYEFV